MSAADVRCLNADVENDLEGLASDGAMTIENGAKFLGCSRSYLYDLVQAGTIATAKLGRHRVIFRRSLIRYLAEHSS